MTGETRPSETEAQERSELSASVIPIKESMKEEKTMIISSSLEELVIIGKVEKFQLRKWSKRKMKMKLR